jgi:hypothetical protein
MQWSCDRTGFPVLELAELGLAVQLLPVSKLQFERFLAEPVADGGLFGDAWYESLLAVSPRVSLRDATREKYEHQFLSGVFPAEAERFARWLGSGYDLPRVDTWRRVDELLGMQLLDEAEVEAMKNDNRLSRPAKNLMGWWQSLRQPLTWGELGLFQDGLLEWVRISPRQCGGLGRPRQEFQRILINPQRDDPVKPIQQQRLRYFGFRLVRPL